MERETEQREKSQEKVLLQTKKLDKINEEESFQKEVDQLRSEVKQLKTQLEIKEKELDNYRRQSLPQQLQIRESELVDLLAKAENKLGKELEFLLEILTKIQVDIVKKGSNPFTEERFQDLATILEKKISREEIGLICQKKREIIYLEEIIQSREIKLEAQVEVQTSK